MCHIMLARHPNRMVLEEDADEAASNIPGAACLITPHSRGFQLDDKDAPCEFDDSKDHQPNISMTNVSRPLKRKASRHQSGSSPKRVY